jgi:DNA-directed RNA polymerase subunit alpha
LLKFVLPKIECEASTKSYGKFTISPLETGYGVTLGSALRRVLLSSLTGAAVTSLRVSGVHHEFSPIPNAKEDMTALILNVKKLRLRYYSEEPVRLMLSTRGKSVVTAADVDCPPDVEIINPELHLLTLDASDTELDIEFVVERGRGYSPGEERESLPIGQIPVDAVFAPVLKTGYKVERTRVGQVTDYDHLVLEVWSDGTVRPAEALSTAAQILVRHLQPVASFSEVQPGELEEAEEERPGIPSKVFDTPIEVLELSMRAYNCLKRAGITKVGEVLEKLSRNQGRELLAIRNFGQKSFTELVGKLQEKGFVSEEEEEAEEGAEGPEFALAAAEEELAAAALPSKVVDANIDILDLSDRVRNTLNRAGLTTVGQILDMLSEGSQGDELLAIRGLGAKSLEELLTQLREKGFV